MSATNQERHLDNARRAVEVARIYSNDMGGWRYLATAEANQRAALAALIESREALDGGELSLLPKGCEALEG